MAPSISNGGGALVLIITAVFVVGNTGSISSSGVECLRSVKSSLRDPRGSLSSWNFSDTTSDGVDHICASFDGVQCSVDSKVVRSLSLGSMGLVGEFPRGLAYCIGLTGLDLSRNNISGSIPADVSRLIGSAVVVDLSHCKFRGEIPADVANCKFLSVLKLNNNYLTGRIPEALASLRWLKSFTVANNHLEVPVVVGFRGGAYFPRESYAGNAGLCGGPLGSCEAGEEMKNALASGLLAGWCASFALFLVFRWCRPVSGYIIGFFKRKRTPKSLLLHPRKEDTMISMLEKFATRMTVLELRRATSNFSNDNVIATAEMGVTYKAMRSNGWHLAVKRFTSSPLSEHEFITEITTIGRVRHKNLVPLLGFCQDSKDRFIIYKLMPNGNLHHFIFSSTARDEWPLRAKIAVGIARGIAWLHANGIVHRRLTSRCIMLDEDFNPRISDFGKAVNHTNGESSLLGCYEEDVHGFGKVLLELMTCKRYSETIKSFDMDGNMLEQISLVMDGDSMPVDEMLRLSKVAARCLECDPWRWPTMEEVCSMLTGEARGESFR